MITKPMLASGIEDTDKIVYPVLCTPKLDGIRCLMRGGKTFSRNFKPIPNKYIRELLEGYIVNDGLDGELVLQDEAFNKVSSAVMKRDGHPDFRYIVFDYVMGDLDMPYYERMKFLSGLRLPAWCEVLLPVKAENKEELKALETKFVDEGYEGIMLRSMNGPYKCGRSTVREGYLLKWKRFADSEAEILGFEERMHNNNVAKKDELGRTKRSSHKANMVGTNTLGKLVVRDIKTGVEFGIGTGYDDATRLKIWNHQGTHIGQIVKYKYQPCGTKDLPRFPVFLGFRHKNDMGE